MDVVYSCLPNSYSYDYLIRGLCVQGRTKNGRDLCNEMKKGFVPSSKAYNSLVNSLALDGEVDEVVNFLREMMKNRRSADLVTYWTEICQKRRLGDAIRLLKELQEKELVDNHTHTMLLHKLKGQPQELK